MDAKLIVFDFDGTLGDTRANIVLTMRETIRTLGLPERSEAEIAATIGVPLEEGFAQMYPGITEEEMIQGAKCYREVFEKSRKVLVPELFPHVKETLSELKEYPCLSFEQGDDSSFYFAEEILSTEEYNRTIKANDRATMLNLMIGLNGYTLCSGIICEELNGSDYIAVPFRDEDEKINRIMEIGWITRKGFTLSSIGTKYIEEVKKYLKIK